MQFDTSLLQKISLKILCTLNVKMPILWKLQSILWGIAALRIPSYILKMLPTTEISHMLFCGVRHTARCHRAAGFTVSNEEEDQTCLVILHEVFSAHVINDLIQTVIVACDRVVVVETIHIDVVQFQFIVCIYSQWVSVFWQRLSWHNRYAYIT